MVDVGTSEYDRDYRVGYGMEVLEQAAGPKSKAERGFATFGIASVTGGRRNPHPRAEDRNRRRPDVGRNVEPRRTGAVTQVV